VGGVEEFAVKTFDWADLLQHHPIFSALDAKEVHQLLHDDVSIQRTYAPGTLILEVGEVGDSIFLIGSGVADAVLVIDNQKITLSVMKKGEIFGEMAFMEGRPRSATVLARETAVVLEINGRHFRNLLDEHPEVEIKVLLKVSERLRNANEQILATHLKSVDEKLRLLNDKLDVEHRIMDASFKAAQTVFDQTKLRTDEVINSAERSRARFSFAGTLVLAFLTLVGTVFGAMGVKQFFDVQKVSQDLGKTRGEITRLTEDAKTEAGKIHAAVEKAELAQKALDDLKLKVAATLEEVKKSSQLQLRNALNIGGDNAFAAFRQLRELDSEAAFNEIELVIMRPAGRRHDWEDLLRSILQNAQARGWRREEIWSYYLLLANALLVSPERFDRVFAEFEKALGGYKGASIEKEMVSRLSNFFAEPENRSKRPMFDRVGGLVLNR
jgi:CRP-like cAMP-binding protein